jgi:hypothetical protein
MTYLPVGPMTTSGAQKFRDLLAHTGRSGIASPTHFHGPLIPALLATWILTEFPVGITSQREVPGAKENAVESCSSSCPYISAPTWHLKGHWT